ncbi:MULTISPECIES: KTSC domain-containing protein [Actinokineospora]|uniref:KTSC domain-containing protein n=2 Tax=Actinokineospora TaxID=39845 RepID=A0A421B597_9PSEU|nr:MULTISPECIES: KTSC domain-containing protein [Actinokineospora]RLK59561.1 KTSC domain-containing protein [Actinokineospora cianjurensis]SES10281.1 KTSC domain-containing protein [Actinokineospora terrae]
MERRPVASTSIAAIGYDADRRVLEVEFHNGGVYQYLDVPKKVYWQFASSPSLGAFLNHEIKDRYSMREVD